MSLNHTQNAEIERRAANGETPPVIAAAVGCNVTTVYRRITDWRQRTGLLPLRAHKAELKAQAQAQAQAQREPPHGHVARLLALVADGVPTKEICAEIGCSRSEVMRHCKLAGVSHPNRYAPLSTDVANSIISMIAEGKTQNFIADHFGVAITTVSRRVARHRAKHGADSLPQKGPGRPLSAETVQKIAHLGQTVESATTIAGGLGLAASTVARRLRADIELRRQSGETCQCGRPLRHKSFCAVKPEVRAARIVARAAARAAARERDRLIVSSQQNAVRRDALYAQIAARIPRWIDAATREDIISDAYLAMLETAQ